MAIRTIIISNILLIFLITSCNNEQGKSQVIESNVDTVITVDSSKPKSYFDHAEIKKYPNDTLLSSGWNVKYYVKNDNTKNRDLYINCSKNVRPKDSPAWHGRCLTGMNRQLISIKNCPM